MLSSDPNRYDWYNVLIGYIPFDISISVISIFVGTWLNVIMCLGIVMSIFGLKYYRKKYSLTYCILKVIRIVVYIYLMTISNQNLWNMKIRLFDLDDGIKITGIILILMDIIGIGVIYKYVFDPEIS